MMNPEIKKRWVDALRSGNYNHGKKELRSIKDEFCCLGVLCDIIKDEIGGRWGKINNVYAFFVGDDDYRYGILNDAVVQYCGLNSNNPVLNMKDEDSLFRDYIVSITTINDKSCNFQKVAELIETQL